MRKEEIKVIIENNIEDIFTDDAYKPFLEQSVLLHNYTFINKFLILFQNKNATDVKSEIEWNQLGFKLNEINNSIYIIYPTYNIIYRDAETKREVTTDELGVYEIDKAIKLGILIKDKIITGYETIDVYNIGDTNKTNDLAEHKIKLSNICSMWKNIGDISIISNKNEKSLYLEEDNKLIIGGKLDPLSIEYIIRWLVRYIISKIEKKDMKDNEYTAELKYISKIDSEYQSFIEDSIVYSICKYFKIVNDIKINLLDDVKKLATENPEHMQDIMGVIDIILNYILKHTDSADKHNVFKLDKMQRAEKLLNIMEANVVLQQINDTSISREKGCIQI